MSRIYKSIKGIANQWEVWEYYGEDQVDFIHVFEYKYQADFAAKRLNKSITNHNDALEINL